MFTSTASRWLPESAGVFSSSCNDMLRVLRANKETLLTILEVMTNDPLYKFLVLPVQKKKAQAERGEDDEDGSV